MKWKHIIRDAEAAILHDAVTRCGADPRIEVQIFTWEKGPWGLRVAEVDYTIANPHPGIVSAGSVFMRSDDEALGPILALEEYLIYSKWRDELALDDNEVQEALSRALFMLNGPTPTGGRHRA